VTGRLPIPNTYTGHFCSRIAAPTASGTIESVMGSSTDVWCNCWWATRPWSSQPCCLHS
jgi:hypothetical protein